ncbi:hypothetical protein [Acidipila rosea]|uniref:Uncharacterized protein n=1 Tax=Acidipila rosea TaxID=768535 RepID=A0A4R1L4U2_9BACT|nr:hypothetical protein [Acidipila rosea]TCK72070.1 hypothetical protein C7378_2702 [Acidipila rosea]
MQVDESRFLWFDVSNGMQTRSNSDFTTMRAIGLGIAIAIITIPNRNAGGER